MVDMFVILLVFLLKSYSTSPVQVNPSKDLRLPQAVNAEEINEEPVMMFVSQKGIYIGEKKIVDLDQGALLKGDLDKEDEKFVKGLFEELTTQAEKTRSIASRNNTVKFDGKILMQADQGVPYELLKKIFYTSSLAGYTDLKFAVVAD